MQTDANLALRENITLKLTLFMKYSFRNPNPSVVWFHGNSLIKKPYRTKGWDAILRLFRLVSDVSDARINTTVINFVKEMGRYVTYISEVTRMCVCVIHMYTHAHTS